MLGFLMLGNALTKCSRTVRPRMQGMLVYSDVTSTETKMVTAGGVGDSMYYG